MKKIAIIGGGVTGLSLAYYLQKNLKFSSIDLYEKSSFVGGKIRTSTEEGFVYEHAANGILDNYPIVNDLIEELNLTSKRVFANKDAKVRYLYRDGKFNKVPTSSKELLSFKQISLQGKLRLILEYFFSKRKTINEDESIYDFTFRHFGSEICDYILDPVCRGIFACNPKFLSVKACMPILHAAEQNTGSIIKHFKKLDKPNLFSFQGGMQGFIDALHTSLSKVNIKCNSSIESIVYDTKTTLTTKEDSYEYDAVISCVDNLSLAKILPICDALQPTLVGKNSPIGTIVLGYNTKIKHQLSSSFGFLVPNKANLPFLGALFSSDIFNFNLDKTVIRIMFGSSCNPTLINQDDDYIREHVLQKFYQLLQIKEACFSKIIRYKQGISMYEVNHNQKLQLQQKILKNKALFIGGSSFDGVSVASCIKNAFHLSYKVKLFLEDK